MRRALQSSPLTSPLSLDEMGTATTLSPLPPNEKQKISSTAGRALLAVEGSAYLLEKTEAATTPSPSLSPLIRRQLRSP